MKIQLKILNKEFYADNKIVKKSGWDKKTEYYPPTNLPAYATPGSAGMDLRCTEDITIYPGKTVKIPTGLAMWIGSNVKDKFGCYDDASVAGFILPRSGLGERGLILANTIGVIDEDYQGELKISAWNRLEKPYIPFCNGEADEIERFAENTIYLTAGQRIAQLVFMPVIKAQFDIVEEFSNETSRGTGGFGSTGQST